MQVFRDVKRDSRMETINDCSKRPPKILFVDEEQFVRKALQRSFRDMRDAWEMRFAGTPDDGLAYMDRETIEVLITEVVFTEHDGLAFLDTVRSKYPHTVRIILSGYVDQDTLLKTVDLAHQFISKPCEDSDLKATIARAFVMKELLDQEPLKRVVVHIDALPSLPALYLELVETLQTDAASFQKVGEIISKDLGLSVKLLKMVNSSFFGLPQRVSSPAKAVSLLGLDLVRGIVLACGTFDKFKGLKFRGFSIEQMWDHATDTAAIAKVVAQQAGFDPKDIDLAFTAGLLHDIGKLLIAAYLPDSYKAVVHHLRANRCSMAAAEIHVLGTTHAPIGAYLLGLWGLPDPIIDAAAYHHRPGDSSGRPLSFAAVTHIANAFANAGPDLVNIGSGVEDLDYTFLQDAGLLDRIEQWQAACKIKEAGRISHPDR